jgi:hypothetical protein
MIRRTSFIHARSEIKRRRLRNWSILGHNAGQVGFHAGSQGARLVVFLAVEALVDEQARGMASIMLKNSVRERR